MAITRRQSQNCGPSGGGIASFGDGGIDAGGTANLDTVTVASTFAVTGVATFTAAPILPAGSSLGGVTILKPTRSWRGVAAAASRAPSAIAWTCST